MPSIFDRLRLIARSSACVLAAFPPTSIIPLPVTMAIWPRFKREDRLRRMHLMVQWARFCRQHLLGVNLDVVGREHLPVPSRGHMYVSNHQSWADILVLMDALDTVAFLSKKLIRYIPAVGRSAYAGGTVFVARSDAASRQKALLETLRMCEESTAVVIFPEGTRSPDGELQPKIHPASIKAAYERRIKVVPLAIDGTARVVPKSMDTINVGRWVAVTIGETLDPKDYADAEVWVKAVWGRVTELFAASRARLTRG
jgi:1-acyl-sn-glycerol-3-phosphate acyltransferase